MGKENQHGTFETHNGYHVPVLFNESLEALNIRPDGIYIDCTFGGGGHSRGILERLGQKGKLIAFDQDADAQKNVPADSRVTFVPQNFRHVERFVKLYKAFPVDGVLADLGVSSHQFDEPDRGFSTRFDGPLDMRMDQRQEKNAREILLGFDEKQLHKLFEQYGEVTNSKTLAKHIVNARQQSSLNTIADLKNLLAGVIKGNPNKYLAQVFQALRIEVNDEMGALKEMLGQLPGLLKEGGRIVVITFHSIEDRIVKNFFKKGSFEEEVDNPFEMSSRISPLKIITKKPLEASASEVKRNPRARSAKLRVAEKAG